MKIDKPVLISQPDLPDLDEYVESLKIIWEKKWLTNNGDFHKKFETELAKYLNVPYVSLFSNGTLALISALQVLRISGEVITTPYSFVATSHSLYWNNIKPVFVDVDPKYGNLDPDKIEAAITPNTTAIMPVHVYGNPADVKRIDEIADIYGLKVIYDAAHAFGVKMDHDSILNYGDISVLSFHATKVFNTVEGGAIICKDVKTKNRIDFLKNFGFAGETKVVAPGINAKMNELQAAYGLLQLKAFDDKVLNRKVIAGHYKEGLKEIEGISYLEDLSSVRHNYGYFPIFIDSSKYPMTRDNLYFHLKANNIYGRRYFYPLITEFSPYKSMNTLGSKAFSNALRISESVICLPIYPGLQKEIVSEIINLIKDPIT